MKKTTKRILWVLAIIVFIVLCNTVQFFHGTCRLLLDGVFISGTEEITYVSADKIYVYKGFLLDTLSDDYYKRFVLMYPNANRRLYRIQARQWWRFWRWRDYATDIYWQQPYLAGLTHSEAGIIYRDWGKKYEPYYGSIPPKTHKDSVQATQHFRKPPRKR